MTDNPLETPGPGRSGAKAARMMLAAVAVVAFVAVMGAVFWLSEQQARKMQVGMPDFSADLWPGFLALDKTAGVREGGARNTVLQ